jgi:hypothetical protein
VALAVVAVRRRDGVLAGYLLALVVGYGTLTLVSAAADLWGLRYQFTFFVVGAALVAAFARILSRAWLTSGLTVLLLLAAIPYVVLNSTRPLLPSFPHTRSAGVLTSSGVDVLSNTSPQLAANYEAAAGVLHASSCREIALDLRRGDLEYLVWWMLAAPQSGFRIQTISPSPETARFQGPAFAPCALVCTVCGEMATVGGLPLNADLGYVRLYLAEDSSGP